MKQTIRRNGFTLIEMLTVIGIIAVLSGIIIPVTARARAKGRQTACLSNLKQISAAVLMYAGDYSNRLPDTDPLFWSTCSPNASGRSRSWQGAIKTFAKDATDSLFVCPSARKLVPDGSNAATDMTGYAYNGAYWKGSRKPPTACFASSRVCAPADNCTGLDGYLKLQKIESPVDTIMAVDSPPSGSYQAGDEDASDCGVPANAGANAPSTLDANAKRPEPRHGSGVNVLFTDGHVKWHLEEFLYETSTSTNSLTGEAIEKHWTIEDD